MVSFQSNWTGLKRDQNCRWTTHLARRVHKLALSIETVSETAQKRSGHQGGENGTVAVGALNQRERHNDQTTSGIYRRDRGVVKMRLVVGREANERDADSRGVSVCKVGQRVE